MITKIFLVLPIIQVQITGQQNILKLQLFQIIVINILFKDFLVVHIIFVFSERLYMFIIQVLNKMFIRIVVYPL